MVNLVLVFVFVRYFVELGVPNTTVRTHMEKINSLGLKIQHLMRRHPEDTNGTYMTTDELEEECPDVAWFEYINRMILVPEAQVS